MARRSTLASLLLSFALSVRATAPTSSLSLLFQNDGNWTEHKTKPSALLIHETVSLPEAVSACNDLGETLLDCSDLPDFEHQLTYQVFLGNLDSTKSVWTACSSVDSTLAPHADSDPNPNPDGRLPPIARAIRTRGLGAMTEGKGRLPPMRRDGPDGGSGGSDPGSGGSGSGSSSDHGSSGPGSTGSSNTRGRLPPMRHDARAGGLGAMSEGKGRLPSMRRDDLSGGSSAGSSPGSGDLGGGGTGSSDTKGRLPPLRDDTTRRAAPLCTNSAPFTSAVFEDFSVYPTVHTAVNGTAFTGVRDHMSFRFMGVPYAQPPIGDLRFAYAEPFNGTEVDATTFKPACLQFGGFDGNSSGLNPWGNDEDCLFLNVFTPFIPSENPSSSSLKPVMLWIHGGDNINGVGSDATFDGGSLATRSDVVLVTINYRLNIFGYLSLNDSFVPGSFALSDKVAALQWVQTHITAFGGDPSRVTVFGQSAGGWSTIDLIKSPKAAGLFSGAIVHSGGAGKIATPATVAEEVLPTISSFCNDTGQARLDCLRALPAEVLLNITQTLDNWPTVIDSVFSTNFSLAQLSLGPGTPDSVNPVHFMAGFMPDEGQSLLGTQVSPNETSFDDALDTLVADGTIPQDLADAVVASGLWNVSDAFSPYNASQSIETDSFLTCPGTAFASAAAIDGVFPSMHIYSMKRAYGLTFFDPFELCTFPVGAPNTLYYLCHSGDLYETFGTYYIFDQPIRVPEDVGYTNLVQDMWGAFARTGDPNPSAEYLTARGYASTLAVFKDFAWPVFEGGQQVAALQFPSPTLEGLPDLERCAVVLDVEPVM